ncbi:hypothetical protein EK21DRAFT_63865 [Setomelanomma holmii]|uniref:F-box domain-containing protein n=1 Tax=Setomelanomma holmii TaxID=210430 RepID=A0A9P4HDA0_9PLEO|nr:hypothetical protein EK21DRAFT_63865 [Setomelanomma holmii]
MNSHDTSLVGTTPVPSSPLPSWLAKHLKFSYDAEDVAALIDSIDSSQQTQSSTVAHLPAEIVLYILEYVPVDHLLDWRLVCHAFQDAIDGRVLYHHLRRVEFIGFVGSRQARYMRRLSDEQYDQLSLLHAKFLRMDTDSEVQITSLKGPTWRATHAVFEIDDSWAKNFREYSRAAKMANRGDDADELGTCAVERLQMRSERDSWCHLSWCMKLEHAVFDADLPPRGEGRLLNFDFCVAEPMVIRVVWKDILFKFLRTERAMRLLLEEKQQSSYTFSHVEDCLRQMRRQRLHASLDPGKKVDGRRKWSLRLLPTLFGKQQEYHAGDTELELVENGAIYTLLLLRREAGMTARQLKHLRQLDKDCQTMDHELEQLDKEFQQFKKHLSPKFEFSIDMPAYMGDNLPRNPIAWSDELLAAVEDRVSKWKSQRKVIKQVEVLLSSSNEALAVPDDSFDDLGSGL